MLSPCDVTVKLGKKWKSMNEQERVCIYVCLFISMYVSKYICMCVCMCVCVCVNQFICRLVKI